MYNLFSYVNTLKRHIRLHGAWGTYQCEILEFTCSVIFLKFRNVLNVWHSDSVKFLEAFNDVLCTKCFEYAENKELKNLYHKVVTSHLLCRQTSVT